MPAFALYSNRVITPEKVMPAYVLIHDEIITDVLEELPGNYAGEVISVDDKLLMPGIIDPHIHINEPGRTAWEGFDTATKAALSGGVTTVVDMPLNASPVTTSVSAFEKKLAAAAPQLHCNCGFWGGIVPGNVREIEPLIERGVLGFKAFLIHSGIDEFPNVTEEDLRKAMPLIAKHRLPLLVHCEMTNEAAHPPPATATSYREYLMSRPRKWEDDAIALMIRLCEEFNCRVHIVHLSSSDSIEQIARAKQKGLPLTVETCQHYLFFHAEEIGDGQTAFKCAPPIREKENNEKLWQALQEGIIDYVATDHSPSVPELKELQSGNFMKAWGGIASLQFALSALWTAAKSRNGAVTDMAQWLCEKPAQIIGKEKTKGRIAKGYDADLVVWDENKTFIVEEKAIWHKNKITPYMGRELSGMVEQTYLAGEKIFDQGKMILNKGKVMVMSNE